MKIGWQILYTIVLIVVVYFYYRGAACDFNANPVESTHWYMKSMAAGVGSFVAVIWGKFWRKDV